MVATAGMGGPLRNSKVYPPFLCLFYCLAMAMRMASSGEIK